MRDLACDANLGVKTRQGGGILRKALGKKLDGDDLAERQIFRAIDFTHSTAASHGHNAIALGDYLSRREAPAADGIGTC